ncbi:ATP synthase subunit I [Agrilutibacter solisilvae]|uniref:ATP synthase subunit I n=1 Tax=Agrilutibacter solisilvae TaxID=2763317 RepID=A0A974XZW2_9GAMM|nr:ATP synthase subunit I [Lysobacter solisilvae]QSX78827.1 ATP synthase subunit I [Lysobacter solisilvae]
MHDPIAAGRRSALRAVAVQAAGAALIALAFLAQGPRHALGAAAGGAAMVLASAFAARIALKGIVTARVAFARLLLAEVTKWSVALAGFVIALGVWRLPPLPTLIGLAASLLVYLVALNFEGRIKRER